MHELECKFYKDNDNETMVTIKIYDQYENWKETFTTAYSTSVIADYVNSLMKRYVNLNGIKRIKNAYIHHITSDNYLPF